MTAKANRLARARPVYHDRCRTPVVWRRETDDALLDLSGDVGARRRVRDDTEPWIDRSWGLWCPHCEHFVHQAETSQPTGALCATHVA